MNVYLIKNKESEKYLNARGKEVMRSASARIFTLLDEARERRAFLSKKLESKLVIEVFELKLLKET